MSNTIQIKRGEGRPDGKLAPYELGFDTSTQQLYIGGPLTEDNQYGSAILINSAGVNLETAIMKTVDSKENEQILQVYCKGVIPGKKYTILLYTMQKSHGNASRYWRHPSNTIPDELIKSVRGRFTGYANLAGEPTLPDGDIVFPSAPEWMKRNGVLQTEWSFEIDEETPPIFELNLNNWINDLLKPVSATEPNGTWDLIGLAHKHQKKASRMFQFRIKDDETGVIGEATNFVTLSNVSRSNGQTFIKYFSIKN